MNKSMKIAILIGATVFFGCCFIYLSNLNRSYWKGLIGTLAVAILIGIGVVSSVARNDNHE